MKKTISLRVVMNVFYTAAIIFPLLLISFFAVNYAKSYIVDISKEYHGEIMNNLKLNIETYFDKPKEDLNMLKNFLSLANIEQDRVFDEFYKSQDTFHHFRIIDSQGRVEYCYPAEDDVVGFDFSRELAFKGVIDGGNMAWSSPYIYIKEDVISINYAIPIGDKVLLGIIHLTNIQEIFEETLPDTSFIVGVTDNTGVYIMHTDYNNVSQRVSDKFVKTGPLSYDEVTLDQKEYYLSAVDTNYQDWKIVLYEPVERLDKIINTFILFSSLIMLIMVVIVILLSQRFNNVILRSLKNLVAKTKDIRAGRYDIQVQDTLFDEINELWLNFEAMIHEIKARENRILEQSSEIEGMNSELENRVVERTNELFSANQELEIALENLKSTQDQLVESEKIASLGDLVAGLAHEINTPLGIILTVITYLQEITEELKVKYDSGLLKKSDFESHINTSLDSEKLIFDNINRSIELMSSFKLISADQVNLDIQEIDMKEFMESIVRSLQPQFKKTNIQLSLMCEEGIKVSTIPLSLYQVVVNLVMNTKVHAYNETGGLVNIKVKDYHHHLEILVEDYGDGIPAQYQKKIFDPFFTTKRGAGGTGLGLNIVYNTVKQNLQGDIFFNSSEGKGTQFVVHIPKSIDESL